MRVAGLIILIFGYWLTVNGLEAEVILSSYFLRGINAQESVDAVGDAGITPYEENGYLSLWARGRDDMMTVTYKVSGVDRSSQSVRITVSYDGEGLLGVKNFSESSGDRLWTDKYLLPKRDRGTKTINVSTSAHTDWRGRMEIYVSVSNDQFITVKSLEVQALDIEPVVRVVREYRYFPDTYYYTVAHWQYRWGPIYVWGPYGYVCYRYWWESPWYVSWYDHYYRTVVVYHPIRYHHYYDYVGQVVVVRDSSSDPPRKIIRREAPERMVRSAVAGRNAGELRGRDRDSVGSSPQEKVAPKKMRRAADIETKTSDERRLAPTRTEPQRQVEERVGKFKIRRTDGSGSVSTNLAPSQQVERQTTQDETVGRFKIRRSSTDFSIEQRSGSSGTSSYSQPTYSAPNREASRSYSQSEIKRRPSQDSVRTSPQEVRSRSQEVRIEVRRESRTESHSSPVPTKTRREEMRSAPTPQPRPAPSVSSSSVKKMREKNKDDETR